jgi:hypothetical protein
MNITVSIDDQLAQHASEAAQSLKKVASHQVPSSTDGNLTAMKRTSARRY